MVNYIKELLGNLKDTTYPGAFILIGEIVKELDRLDPRDFLPTVQSGFVKNKAFLKAYVGQDPTLVGGSWPKEQIGKLCNDLLVCLDSFAGQGSFGKLRTFSFINDKDLLVIIERDYFELKTILFPSGAWKSVVIMAGSILEAVLYDVLTQAPSVLSKATSSTKAPKGKDITKGEWKLASLIEVATEIGILPLDRANTIDQVLRDYRNFVHPKKEIKAAHQCSEAEGYMAIGALEGIFNHFDSSLKKAP